MTEKTVVDEIALPEELSHPTEVAALDDATGFTPEHAPRRRVEYERRVDADGWVDHPPSRLNSHPLRTRCIGAVSMGW